MAGGKGTRLGPYTALFPKPLMPLGEGMPVLELLRTRDEHRVVGHLGPDVLAGAPTATQDRFDQDDALARLRRDPARPIVEALLDQRGVSGLGSSRFTG